MFVNKPRLKNMNNSHSIYYWNAWSRLYKEMAHIADAAIGEYFYDEYTHQINLDLELSDWEAHLSSPDLAFQAPHHPATSATSTFLPSFAFRGSASSSRTVSAAGVLWSGFPSFSLSMLSSSWTVSSLLRVCSKDRQQFYSCAYTLLITF